MPLNFRDPLKSKCRWIAGFIANCTLKKLLLRSRKLKWTSRAVALLRKALSACHYYTTRVPFLLSSGPRQLADSHEIAATSAKVADVGNANDSMLSVKATTFGGDR
jgi:hypothetical protein